MSGPYNNNQGYGQPYQNTYPQDQYGQQNYNQYPQQGGYGAQEFGAPQRRDSYGPPQHGGFQHGQQGAQYGQYEASNPQGHSQYYGSDYNQQQQYPQHQQHQQPQHQQQQQHQSNPGYDAYLANQQYQGGMGSHQQGSGQGAPNHQFSKQSSDPNAPEYDPNAPPMNETDRGILGGLGGAWAGHHFGGKAGHGILGTVAGGLLGSFAEDFLKDKKKKNHSSSGSNYGGSSWGGSRY